MRKAEIIELIRNNQQGLASWAPDIPLRNRATRPPQPMRPNQTQSVRFRPDRAQRVPTLQRPRQPSPQEMDIFEQQEMRCSQNC